MGFVNQNQAVSATERGINGAHRATRAVATKQEARAVHRQCGQQYGRPRRIGGNAGLDAAAKANHLQRIRIPIGGEGTEATCHGVHHVRRVAVDSVRFRIQKRPSDCPGMFGRGIHEEPPIHQPPDPDRRGPLLRKPIRLGRKPPNRDV